MAPKFALFTKESKLPLNKGFKNMFELLQSCAQPSKCDQHRHKSACSSANSYRGAHFFERSIQGKEIDFSQVISNS